MKERIVKVNRISNSPRVIFVDQHDEPMLAVEAGNTEQKIRISGTINTKTTENQKPSINQTIDSSRDITNDSQANNGIKKEQMQPENPIKKHSSKFSMRPEETVKILEEINKKREAGEFKTLIKQEPKTNKVEDNKSEVDNVAEMEIINFWERQSKLDEMVGKNSRSRKALEPWELEMIRLGQLKIGYPIEELKSATKQAKDEIPNGTFSAENNPPTTNGDKTEPKKQVAKEAEFIVPAEKRPGENQPKTEEKNEEIKQVLGLKLTEQMRGLLEKRKAEENLKKYEEKWFNEGLAAEAKAKMEADKKIAAAEEKEAKKVWEIISRPRGIKEKLKIMFKRYPKNPTTYEEKVAKYLRGHYWTGVGLFGVGAAATLGTWAGMQATGNYLPFIGDPIKEVINNLFINGTLVK